MADFSIIIIIIKLILKCIFLGLMSSINMAELYVPCLEMPFRCQTNCIILACLQICLTFKMLLFFCVCVYGKTDGNNSCREGLN